MDESLQPTLVNEQLGSLVGEVDATRAAQLIGEQMVACLTRGERDCLPLECERHIQAIDGKTIPAQAVISKIHVTGAGLHGYVVVIQDLSRVKRLEAEMHRAQRLAALGEMAASIAHEVRSPLGGIELYASLLREQDGQEVQRLSTEILSAVQRLHTTISHLLSFASEPRIVEDAFPIVAVLKDVQDLTIVLFAQNTHELVCEIVSDVPL